MNSIDSSLSKSVVRIIAHVDHGKTTIMDSIIASNGHISRSLAGQLRYLDSRADEQSREITLKLGFIGLDDGRVFIDTPGHVDFESLIFSSALLADYNIIIIDANEGITPRAYTLVKYLNLDDSILVINKIDRCDNYELIIAIINEINGILGCEVFKWEYQNVIISDAVNCCGISYSTFKFSTKNNLKMAFKAYKMLSETYEIAESAKIEQTLTSTVLKACDKIKQIVAKYSITHKTMKNVLSKVMPLDKAIDLALSAINLSNHEEDKIKEKKLKTKFYKIEEDETHSSNFIAITSCAIMRDKKCYSESNILFVCKILQGSIKKGNKVYSTSSSGQCSVQVEEIYKFVFDIPMEVETTQGLRLVCLRGKFLKNSVISEYPLKFDLQNQPLPFFRSKILLNDLSKMDEFKSTIKALSYIEQPLKAKKNKYSEIEIECSGQVQFDKICTDLKDAGFEFEVGDASPYFRECVTSSYDFRLKSDDLEFYISIGPRKDWNEYIFENNECEQQVRSRENVFIIESKIVTHIVESVLEIFTESGPFAKEKIINTEIKIIFFNEENVQYNRIRNTLNDVYSKCMPVLCPLFLSVHIWIERIHLGMTYSLLQRYFYIMEEETTDEVTDFSIIYCQIPQMYISQFSEELRIKTRGTGYMETSPAGFEVVSGFEKVADDLRRKKGIVTDDKIVDNPEGQRTLRR